MREFEKLTMPWPSTSNGVINYRPREFDTRLAISSANGWGGNHCDCSYTPKEPMSLHLATILRATCLCFNPSQ
jgi:hypothetical protein